MLGYFDSYFYVVYKFTAHDAKSRYLTLKIWARELLIRSLKKTILLLFQ